jgi:thiosulfate dehydrogenase
MFGLVILVVLLAKIASQSGNRETASSMNQENINWEVPDPAQIPLTPEGDLIRYGRDLIINTSVYLGPKGKVAAISNGMNCQNCHLDGGTRLYGNNYGAVFSTYPKFRDRSGSIENIYKRVNDCIERSLNGERGLDTSSREMQAIYSYLKWLGQEVPKGMKPVGTGIADLKFLKRPADPSKGETVFILNCQRCHGTNGEGKLKPDSVSYEYPPLWGKHSYSTAAGLFRLSRFAGYVRFNMPFDAPQNASRITDEEAWDVAAFVNSQPRPEKNYKEDWPDISSKPFDYPFGPYADGFSETQHKYGPFKEILKQKMEHKEHEEPQRTR